MCRIISRGMLCHSQIRCLISWNVVNHDNLWNFNENKSALGAWNQVMSAFIFVTTLFCSHSEDDVHVAYYLRVLQYLTGYGFNSLATGWCVRNLKLVTFTLISRTVTAFRVKFPVVNETRPHRGSVTIGLVNGLVLGDNLFSETMLTKLCVTIWCQNGPMS